MKRSITRKDIREFNDLVGLFDYAVERIEQNYKILVSHDEKFSDAFFQRISAEQEFSKDIDRLKALNKEITYYINKFDEHKYFL